MMAGFNGLDVDQMKQQTQYLNMRGAQMVEQKTGRKASDGTTMRAHGSKKQLIGTIAGVAAVLFILALIAGVWNRDGGGRMERVFDEDFCQHVTEIQYDGSAIDPSGISLLSGVQGIPGKLVRGPVVFTLLMDDGTEHTLRLSDELGRGSPDLEGSLYLTIDSSETWVLQDNQWARDLLVMEKGSE